MDVDIFLKKAKEACITAYNRYGVYPITKDEVYITWISKTLQNWKALCSTNRQDDIYVEVTYNGDKDECYVDVYLKQLNTVVK